MRGTQQKIYHKICIIFSCHPSANDRKSFSLFAGILTQHKKGKKKEDKDGSTTAILFKMEQLFVESGNSIFKSIQHRDPDRRHVVLRG